MARGVPVDTENFVLNNGLRLLGLLDLEARERTLNYWHSRARTMPVRDRRGQVLVEDPAEDPPMLQFIKKQKDGEDKQQPPTDEAAQ